MYRAAWLERWLYRKPDPRGASRQASRLKVLLRRRDRKQEAILGQKIRAMICESRGEMRKALRHRWCQIGMTAALHRSRLPRGARIPAAEVRESIRIAWRLFRGISAIEREGRRPGSRRTTRVHAKRR